MAAPAVEVRVPGLLTRFTDGRRSVEVRGETVAASLDDLLAAHPALEPHLFGGRGELRTHLRLFVNGEEVAEAEAGSTPLEPGDVVVVFQAVSGG